MFKYKDASFYTFYFSNVPGFYVTEKFQLSKEKGEENLYVGVVEVRDTIYPVKLRVEIPTAFPHMHLTFRTKSLSGYPHLIHTGKIEHGNWFCLNTPFAETPEEQLNQEVSRLKEWFRRQLREDLPAIIHDENVKKALFFANAYDWENEDEMNEFSSASPLTFIGDYFSNADNFKKGTGHFHCIKTPDNRYYAIREKSFSNYELSYIVVDEDPKSKEVLTDLVSLCEQYGWDDSVCKHLLPQLNINIENWEMFKREKDVDYREDDAIELIDIVRKKLSSDSTYLPESSNIWQRKNSKEKLTRTVKVLHSQKSLLLKELDRLEKVVKEKHGLKTISDGSKHTLDVGIKTKEEAEIEDYIEFGQYVYHFFVLGIREDSNINWIVIGTNSASNRKKQVKLDLELEDVVLEKTAECKIFCCLPQTVSSKMYFGRGAFSESLQDKKIAIVGLGAIGSILAESLARSGVCKLSLWDNDVVEPGNICRSSYDVKDLGESKVEALAKKILSINPICDVNVVKKKGFWFPSYPNKTRYVDGSFYNEINYSDQQKAIDEIKDYNLILDCTGSNEILHFLSYAVPNVQLVSLCITNHAADLVCVTSRDGNPFELRKAYLSRIEQDTKNFYLEGDGCFSPTFLATYSDITSLVCLATKELNQCMSKGELPHSTIWSHNKRGVIADKLITYRLKGYDIRMTISTETLYDGEDLEDRMSNQIGYILGSYSKDGLLIMITHIIDANNAESILKDAFSTSKGIIDYIGDVAYSGKEEGSYSTESLNVVAQKAADRSINTCNPILAVRTPDRSMSFFLYINRQLVPFERE